MRRQKIAAAWAATAVLATVIGIQPVAAGQW